MPRFDVEAAGVLVGADEDEAAAEEEEEEEETGLSQVVTLVFEL